MNIQTQAIITGIRAKVDGSIGFTGTTPEYTDEDKVQFFKLQNKNLLLKIESIDEPSPDTHTVPTEVNTKTPSQKLRNALHVLWSAEYSGKYPDFQPFYEKQMVTITEQILAKIV